MPGFVVKMSERRAGHDGVQVICDRANVFGDRPFVVIQDDDKPLRVRLDVIERFVTDSARKGGVACDDHDILVTAPQIASNSHAERCGKRSSRMTSTIAIVFALGAQKKTVESG